MRGVGGALAGFIAGVFLWTTAAPAAPPDAATIAAALSAPQPLPDQWLGRDDAPVTVIEYASLNCGHCATFEQKILPQLKAQYIDTGKLRFVMRDDPINAPSLAAAKLARCAGPRRAEVIDLLSARLKEWDDLDAYSPKLIALVAGAKLLTRAAADACLKDAQLADTIDRQRKAEVPLDIGVVPAFFVNGKRYESELPLDAIAKLVPAAAPSAPPPAASNLPVYQLIGACDLVAAHDPATAPSIRAADDQLASLALANLRLSTTYRGFLASCPAFLKHEPDSSPAKQAFIAHSYEVGLERGHVYDKAAALRALLKTEPLASLSRRGHADEADYCVFTIASTAKEILAQSDAVLKRAEIACAPAGKP
jgi:protein-disulfide isomerase